MHTWHLSMSLLAIHVLFFSRLLIFIIVIRTVLDSFCVCVYVIVCVCLRWAICLNAYSFYFVLCFLLLYEKIVYIEQILYKRFHFSFCLVLVLWETMRTMTTTTHFPPIQHYNIFFSSSVGYVIFYMCDIGFPNHNPFSSNITYYFFQCFSMTLQICCT